MSEGTDRPSSSACGNPLGGTRDYAPVVPIGAPVIARTDVPDARGWRVYRVAADGADIYDRWIEHDPARAELALAELRAAAAALRQAVERRPGHASEEAIHAVVARRPGDRAAERFGEAPVSGSPAAVAASPRAERRPRMTPLAGNRGARRVAADRPA